MMQGLPRTAVLTEDGTHTMAIPGLGLTYHSSRGAIQESQHVFISAGLHTAFRHFRGDLRLFEMGLGTGLNALLTAIEGARESRSIHYTAVEQYPLSRAEYALLNYPGVLGNSGLFAGIHEAAWNEDVALNAHFTLHKISGSLMDGLPEGPFHVVYFDAFAPDAQPELWTEAVFARLFSAMADGGILTTYCSKGSVRRSMTAVGFTVKKIPGPPGKREMVQAFKYQQQ